MSLHAHRMQHCVREYTELLILQRGGAAISHDWLYAHIQAFAAEKALQDL